MKWQDGMINVLRLTSPILMILLLTGYAQWSQSCPPQPRADFSRTMVYPEDDQLDFRFPLDELGDDVRPNQAIFCTRSSGQSPSKYHAAEDYFLPAGTPLYAMADGMISFSGPAGGYGWLIVIDHPQANIYSLYGHLSPSRWRLESGPVGKGDLIAYLGDPEENGGSSEHPLRPHLHFGIRAGQRSDYPGMGQWRWQAGWIKPCPADVGWLQPSGFIARQEFPPGGFPNPRAGFFEKWGGEFAFLGCYLFAGVCVLVLSIRKNNLILPAMFGSLMIAAGWLFLNKGSRVSYVLFSMAFLFLVVAIFQFVRYSRKQSTGRSNDFLG